MDQDNPLGAFMPGPRVSVAGAASGPLAGLTFAAKDLFDVAGFKTGAGNPDRLAKAVPAARHAFAVQKLLDAGASLVGKTVLDELAFSLIGRNAHYGTPTNVAAPGRFCGGSSCGSAAAVAGGFCDFALGTDTAASIRLPASQSGLIGLRTTHDWISRQGLTSLARSFDTVGWLAQDAAIYQRVGQVLLPADRKAFRFKELLVAEDLFALADPSARAALLPLIGRVAARLSGRRDFSYEAALMPIEAHLACLRTLQAFEAWAELGAWLESDRPRLGPDIAARVAAGKLVTRPDADAAYAIKGQLTQKLEDLLADENLLLLPSAIGPAPLLSSDEETLANFRARTLGLMAPVSLSGLPQISLPLAEVDGAPLGLSLIGPRGSDRALLTFALGLL